MTEPDDPFADTLARLSLPKPSAARMGYAAGLAAGRRRARAWQGTTAVVAVLAFAIAAHRPPAVRVSVDHVVYIHPSAAVMPPPLPMPDATPMLRFREAVLNDPTLAWMPITGGHGMPPARPAWRSESVDLTD